MSNVRVFQAIGVFSLVAGGALAPAKAPAQSDAPVVRGKEGARLDTYLTRAATFGFSGAALVAREGEFILHKGYGLADEKPGIPVTTETVFDICSVTKQFTAAAILKLEMQGKLKTSDRLGRHIDGVPEDKAGITLHHLLTHSSGLPDLPMGDYEKAPRDETVRRTLGTPLLWSPGKRYSYSNAGYSLLGAIVEKSSGQSYESYLDEYLFKPAGMTRTGYRRSKWEARQVAHGYNESFEFGSPLDYPGPYQPLNRNWWPGPYWILATNGGVLSTVGELYRWDLALRGEAVLSPEAKQKLFSPHVLAPEWGNNTHYGYGWNVTRTPRRTTLIHHTGSSGNGFNAWFLRYVDEGTVAILLSNRIVDRTRLTRALFDKVDRILFGGNYSLPPESARLAPELLKSYVGVYRLPSDETFQVEVDGDRLAISARGAAATNLLAFGGNDGRELAARLQAPIAGILRGVDSGDYAPFREALWPERSFEEERELIGKWWAGLKERYGAFRASEVLGAAPHEFVWQVYVWLDFERGSTRILFEQNPDGFFAIRKEEREAYLPRTFLFAPQSAREFASFNLRLASSARLSFNVSSGGAPTSLTVHSSGSDVVARREH